MRSAIRSVPLILARAFHTLLCIHPSVLYTLPLENNVKESPTQCNEYTRDPNTVALHPNVLEAEIIQLALDTVDRDPKRFAQTSQVLLHKQVVD